MSIKLMKRLYILVLFFNKANMGVSCIFFSPVFIILCTIFISAFFLSVKEFIVNLAYALFREGVKIPTHASEKKSFHLLDDY